MSATIALEEVKISRNDLINQVAAGQEIIITENNQPMTMLVSVPSKKRQPRKAGNAKGMLVILQDDDEHLKDFEEYM